MSGSLSYVRSFDAKSLEAVSMFWIKLLFVIALAISGIPPAVAADYQDVISFGDPNSEHSHGLSQFRSEVIQGGLGEKARQLLPLDPVSYNGGSVSFTLKVDPKLQNYFTVKLWGSDRGEERGRLILYIDGLQVGYRHEGDYDVLNQTDKDPIFQGRFLYQTLPLPLMRTQGRTEVTLKIAALGPMWFYGTSFKSLQHNLTQPTRGIYRAYSHTNARFNPDESENQGTYVVPGVRPNSDGEKLLEQMKETVNRRLTQLLDGAASLEGNLQGRMLLLAEAYNTPWTAAYHDDRAITEIIRAGDAYAVAGKVDPGDWAGAGPFGEAIARVGLNPHLLKSLEETIEVPAQFEQEHDPEAQGGPVKMTRRMAWARILRASIDGHRLKGRRSYTNQSMIVDYGIYSANRGLLLVDPSQAMAEKEALRYIYEAVGLLPWLGNDTSDGRSERPYGSNYYLITRKGLSRELGYVGTYGETILRFTCDMADLTGDKKVRQQLIKIQSARMKFRYPSLDADGYRTMKLVGEIDARTAHYPVSFGAYNGANVNELWWMEVPAFTNDPESVGAAQQSLEDNQYLYRLAQRASDPDTLGMMRNIDNYATVKALPKSSYRLPMTDGQPDFVFSDEENAVLVLKHREQKLFLNFYYRQEYGVSGVVRILDVTPAIMRIATVKSQFEIAPSGEEWTRPDVIDFERSGGFPPPGEDIHQALQGEKLPISKRPDDASEPGYGKWGPFVGKAAFYWLRYGDYVFGINSTEDRTFVLPTPSGVTRAPDLASGKILDLRHEVTVGPLTTVVLYLGK
jgi:hypothetical protein